MRQDQLLSQNLDLLAELTGEYDGPARTDGSLARGASRFVSEDSANNRDMAQPTRSQRDRRAEGVAARGQKSIVAAARPRGGTETVPTTLPRWHFAEDTTTPTTKAGKLA